MTSVIDKVNPLAKGRKAKSVTPINHIALLVDESGSMQHLTAACKKAVNEQVATIKKKTHILV